MPWIMLRVVPATLLVIATFSFINVFNSVDFPTFGLPIKLTKPLFIITSYNILNNSKKYGPKTNKLITIETIDITKLAADPQSFATLAKG